MQHAWELFRCNANSIRAHNNWVRWDNETIQHQNNTHTKTNKCRIPNWKRRRYICIYAKSMARHTHKHRHRHIFTVNWMRVKEQEQKKEASTFMADDNVIICSTCNCRQFNNEPDQTFALNRFFQSLAFVYVWRKLNFESDEKWKKSNHFKIDSSNDSTHFMNGVACCAARISSEDYLTLIMKSTLFCIRIVMTIVTSHISHVARHTLTNIRIQRNLWPP